MVDKDIKNFINEIRLSISDIDGKLVYQFQDDKSQDDKLVIYITDLKFDTIQINDDFIYLFNHIENYLKSKKYELKVNKFLALNNDRFEWITNRYEKMESIIVKSIMFEFYID